MSKYCITAARPKNAVQHLNSQFKLWKFSVEDRKWSPEGWVSSIKIATLLSDGHKVLTAKQTQTSIQTGKPVEMEFRISKNESLFKISDMPDR